MKSSPAAGSFNTVPVDFRDQRLRCRIAGIGTWQGELKRGEVVAALERAIGRTCTAIFGRLFRLFLRKRGCKRWAFDRFLVCFRRGLPVSSSRKRDCNSSGGKPLHIKRCLHRTAGHVHPAAGWHGQSPLPWHQAAAQSWHHRRFCHPARRPARRIRRRLWRHRQRYQRTRPQHDAGQFDEFAPPVTQRDVLGVGFISCVAAGLAKHNVVRLDFPKNQSVVTGLYVGCPHHHGRRQAGYGIGQFRRVLAQLQTVGANTSSDTGMVFDDHRHASVLSHGHERLHQRVEFALVYHSITHDGRQDEARHITMRKGVREAICGKGLEAIAMAHQHQTATVIWRILGGLFHGRVIGRSGQPHKRAG